MCEHRADRGKAGSGQYVAFYDTERNRVSLLQPLPQGAA
jgi:hypothetical protein